MLIKGKMNKVIHGIKHRLRQGLSVVMTAALVLSLVAVDKGMYAAAEAAQDFSCCELLIATSDINIFTENTQVLSEYNGIYLVSFSSAEETAEAYNYYLENADMVEINSVVKANEDPVNSGALSEAADNEGNDSDPDGNTATNNDDTTTAAAETAQAQEYSEAHETAEADVQDARESLVDAAQAINTAVASSDSQNAEVYESASDAIGSADKSVYDAANNIEDTKDTASEVDSLIDDARKNDTIVQEQAEPAAKAYDTSSDTASKAQEKAESIDVDSTSLEDANAAETEAEALLDQAEKEKAAADELYKQATDAAAQADKDLAAIEKAISDNEKELASAVQNLEKAEETLAAAKEKVDETKPTEQEKYDLANNGYQSIIDKKNALLKMSEDDEGYQDALKELAEIVLDNYVLSDRDPYFNPDNYRKGEFSFEYSLKDGELIIVLSGLESGYYTSKGIKLDEPLGNTVITFGEDEYKGLYAVDTADKDSYIETESEAYQTTTRKIDDTEWVEYKKIENTEKIVKQEPITNYEGFEGGETEYPVALKITKSAEFEKLKVSLVPGAMEGKHYNTLHEAEQALANGIIDKAIAELTEAYGLEASFELDTKAGVTGPGYTINGTDEDGYTLKIFIKTIQKTNETITLTSTETYKSAYYRHKDGYEEKVVASTSSGKLKKDLDTQLENVKKLENAEAVVTAYDAAVQEVSEAKTAVTDLQEKGKALFTKLREAAAKEADNNAVAHSQLRVAAAAKERAEEAIKNARSAIVNAATKVNLIQERIDKEHAQKEKAEKEQVARGSGSSDNGSDNGSDSGTTTDDDGTSVNPGADGASTNVIPAATPVLALGTDTRATVLGASRTRFYKNLSDELTKQILDQKNSDNQTTVSDTSKAPGDMVKDEAASPLKDTDAGTNTDKSIADSAVPLADTTEQGTSATPYAIAFLLAIAGGITVEEYYRRKAKK